jgi:hypothetical protein
MFYELEGIACAGGLYGRHRPAQSRQLASRIRSGPPFMARHAAPREVSQRIGSTSERCAPCCDGRPDGRRCRSGYSRRCRPIRRTAAGWALRQRTLSPIWRDFGGQGGPRRLAAAQIRMIGARSAVREVYAMPANNRRYAQFSCVGGVSSAVAFRDWRAAAVRALTLSRLVLWGTGGHGPVA